MDVFPHTAALMLHNAAAVVVPAVNILRHLIGIAVPAGKVRTPLTAATVVPADDVSIMSTERGLTRLGGYAIMTAEVIIWIR
ncbi:MAG: hypothetical protein IKN17_07550 [Ruminococcus sp.]|nr:hypothetical protein [Ruminococcus sp.]